MQQYTPTGLVSKGVRFLGTARPYGALRVILLRTLPFENTSFRHAFFLTTRLTTRSPLVPLLCSKRTLGPTQKAKPGIADFTVLTNGD